MVDDNFHGEDRILCWEYVRLFVAFTNHIRTGEQTFYAYAKFTNNLEWFALCHSCRKIHIGLSVKFWGDVYAYKLLGSVNFEIEQKESTLSGELS